MTTTPTATPPVPSGLDGVVVAETAIGDVQGALGFFHYRQYSALDLAHLRSFEDVWHLLERGDLPNFGESAAFRAEVGALRALPLEADVALRAIAPLGSMLTALRTGISTVGSVTAPDPWLDHPERVPGDARRLTAMMPALAAALWRLRNGMSSIAPDATKGVAADYLRMVTGSEPTAAHARALEQYLILTVDHGFNASTFTARVVASTGTDLASAYTGAYSTFIGPLHGGAPSLVLDMLHAIGSPANAKPFIERQLASGNRLMGFGHRIYRVDDPRAMLLRDVALDLGGDLATLAETVEREALDALAKAAPSKPLRTNVEFWASVVMSIVGLPGEMFTPTFAVSRSVGWAAHLTEQTSRNRLIRPASRYVGPDAPVPLP